MYICRLLAILTVLLTPVWAWAVTGVPGSLGLSAAGIPPVVTIELAMTAAQTDTAIVTVGAGIRIVVTGATYTCDNANTVNVAVRIGFGAANTPTTTGVFLTHPGVAPGSGLRESDKPLGIGADGEDVRITSTVPTTGSCRAKITYYTVPS